MKSSIVLPITDQVPFRAYQFRGFEAAVLFATDETGEEFFYNTCINCVLRYQPNKQFVFDFTCKYTPWFSYQDVFYIETQKIDCRELSSNIIISRVKNYLDQKIYVSGYFNEKYIPHKNAYQSRDFKHEFLIYGYNLTEEQFYAIGYTDNKKFEFYTVNFLDFANGFLNLQESELWLYYRNPSRKISFNLESLYYELEDYLHSDYTVNNAIGKSKDDYYGLYAMHSLWIHLRRSVFKERHLDVRFSRFFFEHKEFMMKRLSYLHEKGYIKDYSDRYAVVVQKAKTMHLLFLKYNYKREPATIEAILRFLNEANQLDAGILFNVYDELKPIINRRKEERFLYE